MKFIAYHALKTHGNLFKEDMGEFPSGKEFNAKIYQN